LGGVLAVTGNYPGKARTLDELRADLERALSLLPGEHRLNLHALYSETGGKPIGRDELLPEHFARWTDWAVGKGIGLDLNPSLFSHPLAAEGVTLSHPDPAVRRFWVDHAIASRRTATAMGKATGSSCVNNV
jgi:L-rhamnose isomerase